MGTYVSNDLELDCEDTSKTQFMILTGPNMAGKSTYMRQNALIAILAQIGSFVPADYARIGLIDKIFTRVGASDDLTLGQSTFMVEMTETAYILNSATNRSLILIDEIGRGTSTYDGVAIAWSVAEYIGTKVNARCIFATHYHELSTIENELPNVKNYNIAVKKRGDKMIFLRKIIPGATDDSFGVEVAKLAGLPNSVVARAREILAELESQDETTSVRVVRDEPDDQISMLDLRSQQVCQALEAISVETLTPIEAMNELYKLKKMLD